MSEVRIQYIENEAEGGNTYVTIVPLGTQRPWTVEVEEAVRKAGEHLLDGMARDLFAASKRIGGD